ncbi:MAG: hypothetical protein OEY14_09915, partial [Myxococcales bacterium]|nr:hypothetical protein [Myxococcales bacterium]
VIETDMAIPGDIDAIRMEAIGSGMATDAIEAPLTGADAQVLPLVVTLVPKSGADLSAPFTINVSGLQGGASVVTRSVETYFLANQPKILHIMLRGVCRSATCAAEQTCGNDGTCTAIAIDPASLPRFTGTPTTSDAGGGCEPTDPSTEACDGVDNDCNGAIDEGNATLLCPYADGAPTNGSSCTAGACAHDCDPGFGDCDGIFANGCETDVRGNARHCGGCGITCAAGEACGPSGCLGNGFSVALAGREDLTLPGVGDESIRAVASDPDGNLYVAGSWRGTLQFDGLPVADGAGAVTPRGFVLKLSPTGGLLASKLFPATTLVEAIGVDDDGDVTLVATFSGSLISFGGGTPLTSSGADLALVRLDSNLGWIAQRGLGSTGDETFNASHIAADGTITLAGQAAGSLDLMAATVTGLFVARWAKAADGSFMVSWAKSFGSGASGAHSVAALDVNDAGVVYLAGTSGGGLSLGSATTAPAGPMYGALFTDGANRWGPFALGASVVPRSIAVAGDSIYLAGNFSGSTNIAGTGLTGRAGIDTFVASIDRLMGTMSRWGFSVLSNTGNDGDSRHVSVDPSSGAVYLINHQTGDTQITGGNVGSISGSDIFVGIVSQSPDLMSYQSPARARSIGAAGWGGVPRGAIVVRGRICVFGSFTAPSPGVDILSGGTPPLADPERIISWEGSDAFLTCFSAGGIPIL